MVFRRNLFIYFKFGIKILRFLDGLEKDICKVFKNIYICVDSILFIGLGVNLVVIYLEFKDIKLYVRYFDNFCFLNFEIYIGVSNFYINGFKFV